MFTGLLRDRTVGDQSLFEVVKKSISEAYDGHLEGPVEGPHTRLVEDLKMDELGRIETVLILEEHFGLDIMDEDFDAWTCIGDIVTYLHQKGCIS